MSTPHTPWPLARHYRTPVTTIRGRTFAWGTRTYIMGIINATPDSFSGDGIGENPQAAAALATRFQAQGADIIDLGAESSRPGAEELPPAEELRRLLPCLRAVRAATDLPLSVDTYHPTVAEAALATGADCINDIWGLRRDPDMAAIVSRAGAHLIAMHNQRGRPVHDVATDISAGFEATLAIAAQARIPPERIILDPGFGFGWTPEQNLEILRRLPELWKYQLPLLIGTSRKSTIGYILDAPVTERLEGTAATIAFGIAAGADIVRVHDVRAMVRVARVTDAIARAHWRYQPPQ